MSGKWRQKLHLEPPRGWLNDPNGLCFFGGKYHVFFQYSPDSAQGNSPRGWGHFESENLLQWEFVGMAISPDTPDDRDGAYSGSAISADGRLHIFYTGNVKEIGDFDYIKSGRGANVITVSSADGRSFSAKKTLLRNADYPPFCGCHVRDPKVLSRGGKYRMLLGARTVDDKGCVLLYSSGDLENWTFDRSITRENFGYMWECPDLLCFGEQEFLSVSPQGLKQGEASFQNVYSSGYFPFRNGVLEDFHEWDYGFDFYAPQTFRAPDGRTILIGWLGIGDIPYSNPTVPLGWQHCLTLPREISEKNGRLLQRPARELKMLRQTEIPLHDGDFSLPFELCGEASGSFSLTLDGGVTLKYDGNFASLIFSHEHLGGGRTVRKARLESCTNVQILADNSSLEIYLNNGETVFSTRFYPDNDAVSLTADGLDGRLYPLSAMKVNYAE